ALRGGRRRAGEAGRRARWRWTLAASRRRAPQAERANATADALAAQGAGRRRPRQQGERGSLVRGRAADGPAPAGADPPLGARVHRRAVVQGADRPDAKVRQPAARVLRPREADVADRGQAGAAQGRAVTGAELQAFADALPVPAMVMDGRRVLGGSGCGKTDRYPSSRARSGSKWIDASSQGFQSGKAPAPVMY